MHAELRSGNPCNRSAADLRLLCTAAASTAFMFIRNEDGGGGQLRAEFAVEGTAG